jgi:hypothetical protein
MDGSSSKSPRKAFERVSDTLRVGAHDVREFISELKKAISPDEKAWFLKPVMNFFGELSAM